MIVGAVRVGFVLLVTFLRLSIFTGTRCTASFRLASVSGTGLGRTMRIGVAGLLARVGDTCIRGHLPSFSGVDVTVRIRGDVHVL